MSNDEIVGFIKGVAWAKEIIASLENAENTVFIDKVIDRISYSIGCQLEELINGDNK